MEKKAFSWFSLVVAVLLPVIAVILAGCISLLVKSVGTVAVFVMMSLIIVACPIMLGIGNAIYCEILRPFYENRINTEIKAIQARSANNRIVQGIYKEEQLALMERTVFFEEIWLISPDLLTEINSGIYSGVVYENLKKGTKYKYFVPNNDVNKTRVRIFMNKCHNNKNLEVYYLDDDFFFLVPHVDFAIYEPMKSITDGKQGYIGLPIEGAKDCFAALMNNDFVDAVIGKLAEKINKSNEEKKE